MSPGTVLAVLFALLAAAFYALAAVFQQREAANEPASEAMRPTLLLRLVRNRRWLTGLACDGGAYTAEAIALGFGAVVIVSPLMQTGLLFALFLGARISHRRLAGADWVAGTSLIVGLAAFLVLAAPDGGITRPSWSAWWPWLVALAVGSIGAVIVGALRRGTTRAVSWGLAAALCYGATGPLTKTVVSLVGDGAWGTLATAWELYLLVACAVLGMLCNQSAFQAGNLPASLPVIAIGTPVFGSLIGVLVYQERLAATTPWQVLGVVVAVAVMVFGIFALARREASVSQSATAADPV